MSTYFYGSTISSCWRGYGLYSTSETNTTETISLTGGFQCQNWGFSISYVDCTVTVGSTSNATTNNSVSTSTGSYDYVSMASTSATITKTTSSQSITLKVVTYNHSGYKAGTSTATTTVTVPALASYTITYNANGGSGAPSSQTKYYGKTLTLSSTVPTRTGYTFLGWSTSSSATTATYSAGGSYTANSAATLYAVWKAAIVAPTLSSFSAYRCDSSGTADDEGEYAYCSIKYSADTGYLSSNVVKTIKFTSSGGTTSTVSPAAQSGTATTILSGFDTDTSYTITATATDTNGSTTSASAKVGVASYIIDISDTGAGVGLLAAAPDDGVRIGADDVGSAGSPIYLNGGVPTACSFTTISAIFDNGASSLIRQVAKGVYVGTMVFTATTDTTQCIFTDDDFTNYFGGHSITYDFVAFANGDYAAQSRVITGVHYYSGGWYADFGSAPSAGNFRINYMVIRAQS